jgi:hypothetical protein
MSELWAGTCRGGAACGARSWCGCMRRTCHVTATAGAPRCSVYTMMTATAVMTVYSITNSMTDDSSARSVH